MSETTPVQPITMTRTGDSSASARSPFPFHVMTKPIGPICNLDCTYCFYLHKEELLPEGPKSNWRMDDATLERYIEQYIASQPGDQVQFAWQGGEPTLMGVKFFERIIELQRKHCPADKKITNALQTNGTLIDDDWARFLKDHDFLVGISIDGPRDIHDHYRVAKGGGPSFDRVMRGRAHLVKHGVPHNALCCVNRMNADRPLDVYRFFRDCAFEWVQFIPIVERTDFETHSPGTPPPLLPILQERVTPWTVLPEQFGRFLIGVFDEWVRHDVGKLFVQIFEECASAWFGYGANLCVFQPQCGKAMAIEHDGSVYSCDHYVYDDYRLGNVHTGTLTDFAASDAQQQFGRDKAEALPKYCRECDVRFMCNGACPKDRFVETPDGEPGLNYLCEGYKAFFTHVDPYMRTIAQLVRSGRQPNEICAMLREDDRRRRMAEGGQSPSRKLHARSRTRRGKRSR